MLTKHLFYREQSQIDWQKLWQEVAKNEIESLDLGKGKFTHIKFPSFPLPSLKVLDLSRSQTSIKNLSIPATCFPNLEYLFVYQSKLKSFSIKGTLPKLKELNLEGNEISVLDLSMLKQMPSLDYLVLAKNPFIENLPEGTVKDENTLENVKEYWLALQEGEQLNDEIRIILLGNSTAGKTSFYTWVLEQKYDKENICSTHEMGIAYNELDIEGDENLSSKIRLNFWDFGGQEFYHVIHQLFLGKNTVYIVFFVAPFNQNAFLPTSIRKRQADGSIVEEEEELEHFHYTYWLQTVRDNEEVWRKESQEKPVDIFLVQNKIDQYPDSIKSIRLTDAELEKYKPHHYIFRLSLEKAYESLAAEKKDQYSIAFNEFEEALKKSIEHNISQTKIPIIWTLARTKIRELSVTQNELSYTKFQEEVASVYPEKLRADLKIDALIDWLRAIGVILYYEHIEALKNRVFINPQWVSKVIYEILDYKAKENQGKFEKSKAIEVLGGDETLAEDFLTLMKYEKFGLIFQIPGTNTFVAPQYLPKDCENAVFLAIRKSLAEYSFTLHYPDVLPSHILTRFISKYGAYAQTYPYWKNGIGFLHEPSKKFVFVERLCEGKKEMIKVEIQDNDPTVAQEIFATFDAIHHKKKDIEISVNAQDFVKIDTIKDKVANNRQEISSVEGKDLDVKDFTVLFTHLGKEAGFRKEPTKTNIDMDEKFEKRFKEATESEIHELLGILQSHLNDSSSAQIGAFKVLMEGFYERSGSFTLTGWIAQVLVFIKRLKLDNSTTSKGDGKGRQKMADVSTFVENQTTNHKEKELPTSITINNIVSNNNMIKQKNPVSASIQGSGNSTNTNTNTNTNTQSFDFEMLERLLPNFQSELASFQKQMQRELKKELNQDQRNQTNDLLEELKDLILEAQDVETLTGEKNEKSIKKHSFWKSTGKFFNNLWTKGNAILSVDNIKALGKTASEVTKLAEATGIQTGFDYQNYGGE
jgi:GTPase SAR1 family protein